MDAKKFGVFLKYMYLLFLDDCDYDSCSSLYPVLYEGKKDGEPCVRNPWTGVSLWSTLVLWRNICTDT